MIGKVKMELREIEFEKLTGKELKAKISNINDEANYMVFILRFPPGATFSLSSYTNTNWAKREIPVKPSEDLPSPKIPEVPAAPPPEDPPASKDRAFYIRTDAWTPEEDAAIKTCENPDNAVRAYRGKFLESKRNDSSIVNRWYSLTKERRRLAGVDLEGPDLVCPYCNQSHRPRGIVKHVKLSHPEKYEEFSKTSLQMFVKQAEIVDDGTIRAPPAEEPVSHDQPLPDTPHTIDKISPNTIVTGMRVRQIKPDRGTKLLGTVTVTARKGELIEVRNGNGAKHWIEARCLEAV